MAHLDELMEVVNEKASAYAKAYNDGERARVLKPLKSAAMSAMAEYNLETAKAVYRKWNAEGDAVRTAIRNRYVPDIKRIQFKVNKDDYMTVVITDAKQEINLPMMEMTLGKRVFHEPNWFNKAEKLCWLYACHLNKLLGDSPNFQYLIEDASREFDFPADVTPTSVEGIVKGLQMVYDAILFIDDGNGGNLIKATTDVWNGSEYCKAWELIKAGMTDSDGVMLLVKDTGRFTTLVANTMHTIITNGNFHVEVAERYVRPAEKVSEPESDAVESQPEPAPAVTAKPKKAKKK